jgi:hypothetical protein
MGQRADRHGHRDHCLGVTEMIATFQSDMGSYGRLGCFDPFSSKIAHMVPSGRPGWQCAKMLFDVRTLYLFSSVP